MNTCTSLFQKCQSDCGVHYKFFESPPMLMFYKKISFFFFLLVELSFNLFLVHINKLPINCHIGGFMLTLLFTFLLICTLHTEGNMLDTN